MQWRVKENMSEPARRDQIVQELILDGGVLGFEAEEGRKLQGVEVAEQQAEGEAYKGERQISAEIFPKGFRRDLM